MQNNYSCYISDLNSFYKSLGKLDFKDISTKKILELKKTSRIFLNQDIELLKIQRYTRIANKIKTNPKGYNATSSAEKALLFMFSVDPNFEAAIIFGESNTTKQIKESMIKYFGIYDNNLIKIENFYIKNFLSSKNKKEIEEIIDRRVFK